MPLGETILVFQNTILVQTNVVSKVCFAEPKGSATSFQGIRGYISVKQ
jgi:hypothetical protein